MKIAQECQVYINITVDDNDKRGLVKHIKKQLAIPCNKFISGNKIIALDIIDDATDLIVLDVTVNAKCNLVPGRDATRLDPPEPAYIEDMLTDFDFLEWSWTLVKNPKYHVAEIEIDDDSYIPSEDFLLEVNAERNYYYDEY